MRKVFAAMMLVLCCQIFSPPVYAAENLIRNGGFDLEDVSEFSVGGAAECYKYSIFTEDQTWNKCARVDVLKYYEGKDGEGLCVGFYVGGAKGGDAEDGTGALALKPNTVYEFSLELRGTVNKTGISASVWSGECKSYGDRKTVDSTLTGVKVQKDWVRYSGTFKTLPDTKRGALRITIYTHEKYGLTEKPDTFLLIDNIELREKKSSALENGAGEITIEPKKCAPVNFSENAPDLDGKLDEAAWNEAPTLTGFALLKSDAPAPVQTSYKVLAAPDALYIGVKCEEPNLDNLLLNITEDGGEVFRDDCVEMFFQSATEGVAVYQFIVNAAGVRQMTWGSQPLQPTDYSTWAAKASRAENAWTVEVKIPYAAIGRKERPAAGESLLFNVGRERRTEIADGKRKTDLSCWSPSMEGFHQDKYHGFLVFGDLREEAKKRISAVKTALAEAPAELPEAAAEKKTETEKALATVEQSFAQEWNAAKWEEAYAELEKGLKQARFLKLAGVPFVLTVMSPTTDSTLPLMPENLDNPPEKIEAFASLNETESLPLVITNLSDKTETYRVVIFGSEDDKIEVPGLVGEHGNPMSPDKVVMREAVRVKDSDNPIHGQRLDPLPRMNEAQTITIPPKDSGVVWVTFKCEDILPGKYSGTVRVLPQNEVAEWKVLPGKGWCCLGKGKDVPLTLTVWPIELSKKPAIPTWMMRDALNEKFLADLTDLGSEVIQLSPYSFKAKFAKDGSLESSDMTRAETEIGNHEKWRNKSGLGGEIRYCIAFSAYHIFADIHANKQFKYGTPEWKKAWGAWLGLVDDTFKKFNIRPDQYVIEVWDEPGGHASNQEELDEAWAEVVESLRAAKELHPQIQTQVTFGATYFPVDKLELIHPYTDAWCLWDSHWNRADYIEFYAKLRAEGKKIWFYTCSTNLRENPYRYYRLHAWKGWLRQVDVIGLFTYAGGPGGHYGLWSFKTAPFGAIVYNSMGNVIPSIRRECLKEGLDDLKYLRKLEETIAEAKAARELKNIGASLIDAAEKFLASTPKAVTVNFYHDETRAEKARREAANLILKLQEAMGK
jgi:hypothetical protein